jgi:hypothetical protein
MAETDIDLSFLDEKEEDDEKKPDPNRFGYALRKEQQEKKKILKELEELRAFQAQAVEDQRKATLRAAGLTDGQIKYFQGEVNPESVKEFLADLGVYREEESSDEDTTQEQEPPAPRFAPTTVGNPPGAALLSREDWLKMSATDPERARKAWQDGKVDLSGLRDGLGSDAR